MFLRFIWCLLFIAVTFSLNSPSLPALTYFQEVTHPFLKMSHKTNHARFWKWSPCKMAAPLRGNIRPLWLLPAPPPPPLSFILTSQCSLARWFYSSKLIILCHRGISSLSLQFGELVIYFFSYLGRMKFPFGIVSFLFISARYILSWFE